MGVDREEIIELVRDVELEITEEDFTGASREQMVSGTCSRIRNRIRDLDANSDQGSDV